MTLRKIRLPIGNCLPSFKSYIMDKWQRGWTAQPAENKLKTIKPSIYPWPLSLQSEEHNEVYIDSLRIGQTNFPHVYLMSPPHDPLPECHIMPYTHYHSTIHIRCLS